MTQIDRSFVGEGIVYARAYQSADPLLDIGNCDAFNLSFATNRTTLPNYRGGGGNRNVREQVTDVTATLGMFDITATNLARVTKAVVQAIAAGAVTNEVRPAGGIAGELIPFKNLPDLSQEVTVSLLPAAASASADVGNAGNGTIGTVTVTGAALGAYAVTFTSATAFDVTGPGAAAIGSGTVGSAFSGGGLSFTITAGATPFIADDGFTITVAASGEATAGVDYLLTPHGITRTAGSAITSAGVAVSYTKLAADAVQMLAGSQVELELYIAGLNDAQSGEPFALRARRVKFGVASELPVFGTEYLRLEAPAELLADDLITATGISKFCEMQLLKKVA
ncbi:hypothetical protein [Azotobacter salinestris]|uniref:hypothetical protein n=1 Tax=Azotobacter salinestris TaxID=69964 RepID=UPI0032DE8900